MLISTFWSNLYRTRSGFPRALDGQFYGRARLLLRHDWEELTDAGPGLAVGLVGIRDAISPGSELCVMRYEKTARAASQQIISRTYDATRTITLANSMVFVREERAKKAREERDKLSGVGQSAKADEETEVGDDVQVYKNKNGFLLL